MKPTVVAVSASASHRFSKFARTDIHLIAGLGVEGDAHAGQRVQHRSRVKADPTQPNLRQVHLMHSELLHHLQAQGFAVEPGVLGENITTSGLDLLALPRGTLLKIGASAVIEVTGLRNPCRQLEAYQPGLMAAVLERTPAGELIRKAGIMGVVRQDGVIAAGDRIETVAPGAAYEKLEPV